MIRITLACPAALAQDARDMMMALGHGPSDGCSFAAANWVDGAGQAYAVASALFGDTWPERMQRPLTRPGWDCRPYRVNLAGAERARAVLRIVEGDAAGPGALAGGRIVAVTGMRGRAALAALGLQEIETPAT